MTHWIDPHFDPVSIALVAVAAVYTTWSGLWQSPRRYRALVEARAAQRSDLARRFYRRAIAIQGLRCAFVLAVLVTDSGVRAGDLGLRMPVGNMATTWGVLAYVVLLLALSTVALRRRALSGRTVPGLRLFEAIVARPGERTLGAAMAVGAGVSEELLFRGLFIAAAAYLLDLGPTTAMVVISLWFGAMHLYQGRWGVLGTTLVGFALGSLYLSGHSLLVPILIHIAADVRAMLFIPLPGQTQPTSGDRLTVPESDPTMEP